MLNRDTNLLAVSQEGALGTHLSELFQVLLLQVYQRLAGQLPQVLLLQEITAGQYAR